MKRALLFLLLCGTVQAAYLGSWAINDYVPITANTHRFSTGAAYDATSITYRIYEDETNVEIVTDTAMAKFDTETGFYLNRVQLLSATGFEAGKCYTVLIKATVDGVAGTASHTFQIGAQTALLDSEIGAIADEVVAHADANSVMLAAIKAMTDLMAVQTTTVADSNDANDITLTAGIAADNAWLMHAVMVQDATDNHSEVRWVAEYDAQLDVTFDEPLSFAPTAGDKVWVLGVVYGGLLQEIEHLLHASQAPIYYMKGNATGGAGGTTYYDNSGDDP